MKKIALFAGILILMSTLAFAGAGQNSCTGSSANLITTGGTVLIQNFSDSVGVYIDNRCPTTAGTAPIYLNPGAVAPAFGFLIAGINSQKFCCITAGGTATVGVMVIGSGR